MGDLFMRVLALERMITVLWTRITALEARIAAQNQQNANRWY